MLKTCDKDRWETAQKSEKEFWEGYMTKNPVEEYGPVVQKKLDILMKEWAKDFKIDEKSKILEVGCGGLSLINYFKTGKKYSIDPLADFFKDNFNIDYKSANLIKGTGENLPYPNNYFDWVILINVLDHVYMPEKTLVEIKRVLKEKGVFYIEVQYYQKRFLILSKIWGKFKKLFTGELFNINHPYMFSLGGARNLVSKYFNIISERKDRDLAEYMNLRELKKIRMKQRLSKKIPAIFGIYGNIIYSAVCRK